MSGSILIYVRPWSRQFYPELARLAFPELRPVTVSEFRGDADHWIGEAHYGAPESFREAEISPLFDRRETRDIITRCRFLRGLPTYLSELLVARVALYLDRLLEKVGAAQVIGTTIDNYTTDILERLSVRRGIRFHSICGHFVNGYCRLTARGELVPTRRGIADEEVDRVLAMLSKDDFRPYFLVDKKARDFYKYWARELVKKQLYFPFKRWKDADPLNYHYGTVHSENFSELKHYRRTDFFTREPSFEGNTVYLPLHLTPEATVDYWCEEADCAWYEASIVDLVHRSSKEARFLIKDNPAMLYVRNPLFYERLLAYPNVQLVHPGIPSNHLVRNSRMIYVYTGSVGVEAVLRGKPVLTRTRNYYSDLHPAVVVRDSVQGEDFAFRGSADPSRDSREMIRRMLEGLIPTRFHNNWNIMKSDIGLLARHVRESLEIA